MAGNIYQAMTEIAARLPLSAMVRMNIYALQIYYKEGYMRHQKCFRSEALRKALDRPQRPRKLSFGWRICSLFCDARPLAPADLLLPLQDSILSFKDSSLQNHRGMCMCSEAGE